MREKEQLRETKSPVNRLLPRHGRSASTLLSQEVVQFASGDRGHMIEQTLQRDKGPRQQVGALVGTGMVRKMLEDKDLSFSDAPAVYIDWTVSGEAVVSGRTHSGLVDGAKPGRDTLNRKEATLCRTGRRRTRR